MCKEAWQRFKQEQGNAGLRKGHNYQRNRARTGLRKGHNYQRNRARAVTENPDRDTVMDLGTVLQGTW